MRIYLDTEFLEGKQTIYQWGMKTDYWFRLFALFILIAGAFAQHYATRIK